MTDRNPQVEESAASNPPSGRIRGPVVVGVVPGQPSIVIERAADLAASLDVELLAAHVDVTRYALKSADGSAGASAPIDPDGWDETDDVVNAAGSLRAAIASELEPRSVRWSFVELVGEPAAALGRLAETRSACVIVVGTRERGIGARLEELLTGSVAVHLSHRQNCPVLVVPITPHPAPATPDD